MLTCGISTAAQMLTEVNKNIQYREALEALYKAQGYNSIFFFADGFTYTESNDVGIYEDGTAWTYADSDSLPVTIAAGTVPSEGVYSGVVSAPTLLTSNELSETKLSVGTLATISNHGNARFLVESGGVANGFDTLDAGNGNTAKLVLNGWLLLEYLGVEFDNPALDSYPAISYAIQNYKYITSAKTGTLYVSDEIVPKDGTVFQFFGQTNSTGVDKVEFAKFGSSNFTGKAIVRCSGSPIGGDELVATSGAYVGGFYVDAEGADCGLYARYFTNESRIGPISVRNSSVCDIAVNKLWFSKVDGLTSMRAKNVGISLGYPMFGETGDTAVNAIEFEHLRCNRSGQGSVNMATWVDGVDVVNNSLNGAGIILKTNACNFPVIQAEKCVGVGIVDVSAFNNSFGTIYTENNTDQLTAGRRDFVGRNSGSGKVTVAQNIFIGGVGDNGYYLEKNSFLDVGVATRNSSVNTFFTEDGQQVILRSANAPVQSNQDSDQLKLTQIELGSFYNINHRYTTQYDNVRFYSRQKVSYPYVVLVPRVTITTSSNILINIDGGAPANYGSSFIAGEPVTKRHSAIQSGSHKISSESTLPTSDAIFDIYVYELKTASGFYVAS